MRYGGYQSSPELEVVELEDQPLVRSAERSQSYGYA